MTQNVTNKQNKKQRRTMRRPTIKETVNSWVSKRFKTGWPMNKRKIFYQVKTKEIMTVTLFRYLILISVGFTILVLRFLSSFSFNWEDISNTKERVYPHFHNTLELVKNTPATRRIFNSLVVLWECGQMQSFVFDIWLQILTFPGRESMTGPMYLCIHSLSRFLFTKELSL